MIADKPDLTAYRRFYAEEICAVAHVSQPELMAAFARVPREKYLGEPPWQIAGDMFLRKSPQYASTIDARDVYHNVLVALKSEQYLNNGQPSALATWIAALAVAPGHRVFHVGCGTGYYTAILAELAGANGFVLAAEVDAELSARAADSLRDYGQVRVQHADGATIDPDICDAILINAGVTHPHPAWLASLRDGGRMVLPLTLSMATGAGAGLMIRITRKGQRFAADVISQVAIFSSTSVRDAAFELLLRKALESQQFFRFKSVRTDAH